MALGGRLFKELVARHEFTTQAGAIAFSEDLLSHVSSDHRDPKKSPVVVGTAFTPAAGPAAAGGFQVLPRCTVKIEQCKDGCKIHCACDDEVAKKTWFNTSVFPKAKFTSSAVAQTGPDRYEARGKLSIKGIGQDVSAPFSVKRAGDVVTYEGGFTLKRLQFKIGEGIWSDTETVADEVQVKFRIVTTGNK